MPARIKPIDETRQIDRLREFPSQSAVFEDLTDQELQDLAADIAERGLRQRVEILPENAAGFDSNTIVSGHQRVRALRLLGRSEVPVKVRHDLANASRHQIEAEFVKSNIRRRQLTTLQIARAEAFLYWSSCDPRYRGAAAEDPDLAQRIAEATGKTGRHLKRVMRILDAPLSVQRACDAGRLRMVLAERVTGLPEKQQQDISRAIESGEDPNRVVATHFAKPAATIEHAVQNCMMHLVDAMLLVQDRLAEIPDYKYACLVSRHCQTLDECRQFIAELKSTFLGPADATDG